MKHVKPIELLSALDAFAGLDPQAILSHPAWGVSIPWDGATATLRADAVAPAEMLNLSQVAVSKLLKRHRDLLQVDPAYRQRWLFRLG